MCIVLWILSSHISLHFFLFLSLCFFFVFSLVLLHFFFFFFFFFQAEDGIRDRDVTGAQTCALPISQQRRDRLHRQPDQPGRVAAAVAQREPAADQLTRQDGQGLAVGQLDDRRDAGVQQRPRVTGVDRKSVV